MLLDRRDLGLLVATSRSAASLAIRDQIGGALLLGQRLRGERPQDVGGDLRAAEPVVAAGPLRSNVVQCRRLIGQSLGTLGIQQGRQEGEVPTHPIARRGEPAELAPGRLDGDVGRLCAGGGLGRLLLGDLQFVDRRQVGLDGQSHLEVELLELLVGEHQLGLDRAYLAVLRGGRLLGRLDLVCRREVRSGIGQRDRTEVDDEHHPSRSREGCGEPTPASRHLRPPLVSDRQALPSGFDQRPRGSLEQFRHSENIQTNNHIRHRSYSGIIGKMTRV